VQPKNPQFTTQILQSRSLRSRCFSPGGVTGAAITRSRSQGVCEEALRLGGVAVGDVSEYLAGGSSERPEYQLQFIAAPRKYAAAREDCENAPF
jgi:hypothetical protein